MKYHVSLEMRMEKEWMMLENIKNIDVYEDKETDQEKLIKLIDKYFARLWCLRSKDWCFMLTVDMLSRSIVFTPGFCMKTEKMDW